MAEDKAKNNDPALEDEDDEDDEDFVPSAHDEEEGDGEEEEDGDAEESTKVGGKRKAKSESSQPLKKARYVGSVRVLAVIIKWRTQLDAVLKKQRAMLTLMKYGHK